MAKEDYGNIGIIGAGNMGSALAAGIVEGGMFSPDKILVSDVKKENSDRLALKYKTGKALSNAELVGACRTIILAVKPGEIKNVLEEISSRLTGEHLLISIAAGVPIRAIADTLQKELPIIRVMPNTPAMVGTGITAMSAGPFAGTIHVEVAVRIFSQVGETVVVEEKMMDAVTALSGSGPGYMFMIMESLVEAGVDLGLEEEIARKLAVHTVMGSGNLAIKSKETLAKLRENVTSPGGTTNQGLAVMRERGLRQTIVDAVRAAYERSREISEML